MITEMRTPLANRIIRYIHKISAKKTVWSFGWSESPTRTNSVTMESLVLSMFHIPFLQQHSVEDRTEFVNTMSVRAPLLRIIFSVTVVMDLNATI